MVQDANASDDFIFKLDSVFQAASESIGRITDDSVALGGSLRTLDSNNFAVFKKYLVDVSIEHECSTIDSTDSRESFGDTSKTEDRIDERRRVLSHGVHIELDFTDELNSWATEEAVVGV